MYVATDLTVVYLGKDDWNDPPCFWLKRGGARRLYYRLTPAVYAWLLVRLDSLEESIRISVDEKTAALEALTAQLRVAVGRMAPIREWVNREWYDASGKRIVPEERPKLPPPPISLAELEAWDRRRCTLPKIEKVWARRLVKTGG
jgi:hypothetical protein